MQRDHATDDTNNATEPGDSHGERSDSSDVPSELEPDTTRFPFVRPVTRADCRGGYRPCPIFSCSHNLLVDVGAGGRLQLNTADRKTVNVDGSDKRFQQVSDAAVSEWFDGGGPARPSCALDVVEANPDGLTLAEIGDLLHVTRENIRLNEVAAFAKLRPELAAITCRGVVS